jgi:hypothetical protein
MDLVERSSPTLHVDFRSTDQGQLAEEAKWSPRRSVLFIVASSLALWSVIGAVILAALS